MQKVMESFRARACVCVMGVCVCARVCRVNVSVRARSRARELACWCVCVLKLFSNFPRCRIKPIVSSTILQCFGLGISLPILGKLEL